MPLHVPNAREGFRKLLFSLQASSTGRSCSAWPSLTPAASTALSPTFLQSVQALQGLWSSEHRRPQACLLYVSLSSAPCCLPAFGLGRPVLAVAEWRHRRQHSGLNQRCIRFACLSDGISPGCSCRDALTLRNRWPRTQNRSWS